jgi:HK97 gp10 family phage protein
VAGRLTIKGKLEGLEGVLGRMSALRQSARGRIQRKAVNKATRPLAKDTKLLVPVETGTLKRSIGSKVKTYKSGTTVGLIGPRKGMGREVVARKGPKAGRVEFRDPVRYAHLVEFGTRKFPARPFIRPAWDGGKLQAARTIAQVCKDEIFKEAAKRGRH